MYISGRDSGSGYYIYICCCASCVVPSWRLYCIHKHIAYRASGNTVTVMDEPSSRPATLLYCYAYASTRTFCIIHRVRI